MSSTPSLHPKAFVAGTALPSRSLHLARHVAVAFAASVFVAVCAHVAVPLPLTPVPFTLQPFAVLLVGMVLGPAMGFAALALYLLEGVLGMPVFTPMGLPGLARLIGPTGGYLFAYPVAAALAGAIVRLLPRVSRFITFGAGGLIALATIYTAGVLWFSYTMHVGVSTALAGTVLPFVAFDFVKLIAAAAMASCMPARAEFR